MAGRSLRNIISISFERDHRPEPAKHSRITLYSDFCASAEFLRFLDDTNRHPNVLSMVASPSAVTSFKTASLYLPCRLEYPTFGNVKESIQWPDGDHLVLMGSMERLVSSPVAQHSSLPVRIFVTPAWHDAVALLFSLPPSPRFQGRFSCQGLPMESRVLLCPARLSQQILLPRGCKDPRAAFDHIAVDLRGDRGLSETGETGSSLDYSPCGLAKALTTLSRVQQGSGLQILTV